MRSHADLLLLAVLLGQPCGLAVAREGPGARWQERNDRGNRWEGRPELPVSRPDLELLSFVGYRQDIESGVELTVLFYLSENSVATVFGQHLRESGRYYMKSKPADWRGGAWNRFGPWPTAEVLDDEEIAGWDLGVHVEIESPDEIVLAPALLYHSEPPSGVEQYTLHLRPNQPLIRLDYRVVRAEDGDGEPLLERRLPRPMRVGEPIRLELETAELAEGWLLVEVAGKVKNRTEKARFEMRFFHRAAVEPPG